MTRHNFSYWMTVTPTARALDADAVDRVSAAVRERTGLHESDRCPSELRFEVDPAVGVTEEVVDMCDLVRELSRANPDLVFSIREQDEDDKSNQHALRVRAGETIYDGRARVVEADTAWDDVTVKAVVAALRDDFHQTELAHFIAVRFRNSPWRY